MSAARKIRPKRVVLSEAQAYRLSRFPFIRKQISGALSRAVPMKADIPMKGKFVHFRLVDPKKFHPGLFSTMKVGKRGTLIVIGTPKSAIRKPAKFRAFLKKMGWNASKKRWKKKLPESTRRDMIYQMRDAGIISGAKTQAVLVPISRVQDAARKFISRPEVRSAIGAVSNPLLATLGFNPPKKTSARKNISGNIGIPFRNGQKIRPADMRAWIRNLPAGPMKTAIQKRFEAAMKQYRKFHLGSEPKHFEANLIPMGSQKGITDVDFVVSEGREWAAPYQVPKHSGKYDRSVDGRYLHAHGESGIDVSIKRPKKRRQLPERFHTADGKFVGVIPKGNVKIDDWYRG